MTAIILSIVLSLFLILSPTDVKAAGSCAVTVSPSSVATQTDTNFSFAISNTGSSPITTVRLVRPSVNFSLENYGVGGWNVNANSEIAELTGGSIAAGVDSTISYHAVSGSSEAGSVDWTVQTNDGSGLVNCTGSLGTSILGANDINAPDMTNVVVTGIYATQATITWTTNESSVPSVSYSVTSGDYNLSKSGSSGTSHSLQLTGLSANTTYYVVASSVDASGNTTSTDEFSFTTAAADAGVATTVTVTTTTTTNTVNTVTKILVDSTPPSVRYKTVFKKIYEESPLVEVVSNDGTGIARIEYSIDGGANFSPIDISDSIGDKQITSEFTPNLVEDGDYSLVVKVTDTTGNKVLSKEVKFTIDRLPPRVGPLTVMAGPLIINNNSSEIMELLAGVEYKFILTAAGGPNKISMTCNSNVYAFDLNRDMGVWTAKVKFSTQGGPASGWECIPEITAEDGAGNIQTAKREQLIVNSLGQAKNSTITVYWYDDFEKKFVKWDATSYGQINPIVTEELGGYSFLLPAGKYYLEAKAIGKRTGVSNIITALETVYINDDWILEPSWKFWQLRSEKKIIPKRLGSDGWKDTNFSLPKVSLNNLNTLDIRGRSSVLGLLSSWHPTTNSYLKTADELTKGKIKIYPILMQEKNGQAATLKRRGGYETNLYADQDGEIIQDVIVSGLPTTWIVNRFGQVVKTKVGEITVEETMEVLNSLD